MNIYRETEFKEGKFNSEAYVIGGSFRADTIVGLVKVIRCFEEQKPFFQFLFPKEVSLSSGVFKNIDTESINKLEDRTLYQRPLSETELHEFANQLSIK